jgi:hypothetical protein
MFKQQTPESPSGLPAGQPKLEAAVLEMLLFGDSPVLEILRVQRQLSESLRREMTGVGFFTFFALPDAAPRLVGTRRFHLGDVSASILGLKHGAGFVLFVTDGSIDNLEGFSYDEPWPADVSHFELYYEGGRAKDLEVVRREASAIRR